MRQLAIKVKTEYREWNLKYAGNLDSTEIWKTYKADGILQETMQCPQNKECDTQQIYDLGY
jgi:hypothetical protein